jgi:hypothetical protein
MGSPLLCDMGCKGALTTKVQTSSLCLLNDVLDVVQKRRLPSVSTNGDGGIM